VQNLGQAVGALRRANPRVRTVLHMHCEWLSQLPRDEVREWVEQADLILGCSDYLTGTIAAAWPEAASRCATLYNGVDTREFQPGGAARGIGEPGDEIVLFVGRITPEKGLHVLLDAFDRVLRERPRARLVIGGPESITPLGYLVGVAGDAGVASLAEFYPGSYLDALKRRLGERTRERVTFVGPVGHDVLPEWYRAARVLVNPSLSE